MAIVEHHMTQIKKCVTFIFAKNQTGTFVPNGTGFFVDVKAEKISDRYFVYLVTAKHVLQDANGNFLSEVMIRLNRRDGNSDFIEVPLNSIAIYTHEDKDVDIAVIPFLPKEDVYDFLHLQYDLIATKEEIKKHNIIEGDDVFFAGLFTSHVGQKKNQPIIRFGKVALMTEEKVEWKQKDKPAKFLDLYLLECQSFGGNSGSPVFFQLSPTRDPKVLHLGSTRIYLAGIMMGSFLSGTEVATIETGNTRYVSLQNVGIAAVTPAYKLHELLYSESLKKVRETQELEILAASPPSVTTPKNPP